jgi:hypothetical protein
MPVDVPIGKGKTVTVLEPTRDKFAGNLGGAVEYSLAHLVYKLFEIMGGSVGAFLGGAGVQFLEAIEPSLVEYTLPLIDLILKQDKLDPNLRTFFTQLRSPTHEGAATILGGLASQAGGAVAGTFLSALLKPVTNSLNQNIRGTVPPIQDLNLMLARGKISATRFTEGAQQNGLPDDYIYGYGELSIPRPGVGDLYQAVYRDQISMDDAQRELRLRNFNQSDIDIFTAILHPILDIQTLITAMYRGLITPLDAIPRMAQQGYSINDINTIIMTAKPLPGPGDLIRFGVREAYNDSVSAQFGYDQDFPAQFAVDMAKLGFDPEWAIRFWRAHWELPSLGDGAEMVHRGLITEGDYAQLLHLQDIAPGWRQKLTGIIYNPYTRVDVRRMYGQGILTREQVKRSYMDGGYDEEHAENLTAWTIAYEDGNGSSIPAELQGITEGIITSAVAKGMMSDGDAKTALLDLKNAPDVADLMIKLAHWKAAVANKPETIPDFAKDVRAIVERAYLNELVDLPTATSQLLTVGYTQEEVGFILQAIDYNRAEREQEDELTLISNAYLAGSLKRADVIIQLGALNLPATQQALLLAKWDAVLALPNRRLTEAQYRAAFKAGLITADDYTQFMTELGYSANDVLLLTQLYTTPTSTPEVSA